MLLTAVPKIYLNTLRLSPKNNTDGVPYDGVPQNFVERIHTAVTVVFCLLSTAGIVFAIACLYYNFLYRDKK